MTNNFKQEIKSSLSLSNSIGQSRSSFTLIELLVVLALVAILSVVVVMTLNPAELLKQARDSNRLSDLATINTALNLFSTDVTSGFMGTSTIVYVSLPSTTSNCSNLGLPTLPSGYTYNCVTNQNLRNTDGTGWIPVNFNRISSNSPISQLPIDPTNTTSTRLYYTYTPGGSWELNATVEASKNKLGGSNDLTSKDGGTSPSTYELGNNLNLTPIETGDPTLVGYWNFEEGPNSTSTDRSGYGNHGTWYGTSTAEQHYATGKVGNYAGSFNGNTDWIKVTGFSLNTTQFTAQAWMLARNNGATNRFINYGVNGANNGGFLMGATSAGFIRTYTDNSCAGTWSSLSGNIYVFDGGWHLISLTYDGATRRLYIDGIQNGYNNFGYCFAPTSPILSLGGSTVPSEYYAGSIDNVYVYNRALSAAEILAIYNATK